MTDPTQDPRALPPSFTPTGGRSPRPSSVDDAISVGNSGRRAAPRTPQPAPSGDDAVRPEPRIRRQSSREIPVTPARKGTPPPARPDRSTRIQPDAAAPPPSVPPARAPRQSGAPQRVSSAPHGAVRSDTPARRTAPPTSPPRTSRPGGPGGGRPPSGTTGRPSGGRGFRVRRGRVVALVAALALVLVLAWPVGLLIWADGKIQHVDALSGAPGTPGETYLLAGSDARGEGISEDGTQGARTDTIMLLHAPSSGPVALISIPRDTYAEIPGQGANKLNAAYAWGGPALLVQSVEQLSGLSVDHYVEVGFGGVEEVVDAVGGVELCLDYDVDDPKSELVWTAGCHQADGKTALAFSRMRYSDPKGDIGRAERQRQVIGAISSTAADPSLVVEPGRQVALVDAGLGALTVDDDTGIIDLGRLALAFRKANGPDGVTGTPPIGNPDYRPGGVGSTVQLDPDTAPQFWTDLRDGKLEPGQVGGMPS
ncbi:LCP family protein [Cellulosimicrobium arenosum]|uniref:LCP family protein n=1 Tax=Cellulosimicrobium arenosum TaxID=2708133 RepID=A0A927PFI5_9MICO|nr:LCP family protein [Cellulosimicrobium arenosum]MBD8080206.1 LCP family protein [Cellulosimicrobium arenosum]